MTLNKNVALTKDIDDADAAAAREFLKQNAETEICLGQKGKDLLFVRFDKVKKIINPNGGATVEGKFDLQGKGGNKTAGRRISGVPFKFTYHVASSDPSKPILDK